MANYKVSSKGDFTTVTYRQKDALQINQREMGLLDRNQIPGFMKPRWNTANEMSYLAPTSIPLKKYLTRDCTVDKVYNVFERMIGIIYQVGNNQLLMQNLLLDVNYVFVRPMSNEVYVIYEPYITSKPQANVLAFFMQIISIAKIKDRGQQMQLQQFGAFVSSHSQLQELEGYLKQVRQPQNGMVNPMTGMGMQGQNFTGSMGGFQPQPQNDVMGDEGTTVLGYEDEGTTVLNPSMQETPEFVEPETTVLRREPDVFLVRTKDASKTQLIGNEFSIGRSADNYIAIRDNTDVSRHHAVITIDHGVYAVADCGSKNGTVLNGRSLMPNNADLIQNGDILVFGGEEFTFVVEE